MMPGGYLGSYERYDRNSCACGCGNKAKPGLQPRFFTGTCRERWIAKLAIPMTGDIQDEPVETVPAVELRDEHDQTTAVVTFDKPVTAEQVEEIRNELEERTGRLAVAAQATQPRQESLWRQMTTAARRLRLRRQLVNRVRSASRRMDDEETASWQRLWGALYDDED
jgi:hypothetical protein